MDDTMLAAYKQRHKQAFRIAFETLDKMFPPKNTNDYFEDLYNRFNELYNEQTGNPLCRYLLTAVGNYMGDAVKEIEAIEKAGAS